MRKPEVLNEPDPTNRPEVSNEPDPTNRPEVLSGRDPTSKPEVSSAPRRPNSNRAPVSAVGSPQRDPVASPGCWMRSTFPDFAAAFAAAIQPS